MVAARGCPYDCSLCRAAVSANPERPVHRPRPLQPGHRAVRDVTDHNSAAPRPAPCLQADDPTPVRGRPARVPGRVPVRAPPHPRPSDHPQACGIRTDRTTGDDAGPPLPLRALENAEDKPQFVSVLMPLFGLHARQVMHQPESQPGSCMSSGAAGFSGFMACSRGTP